MVAGGVAAKQITILAPFRAQVSLLREQRLACGAQAADVTICTIDKYQGLENDCIILSLVWSHLPQLLIQPPPPPPPRPLQMPPMQQQHQRLQQGMSPLLLEWRRINVALTRAKKKLVIIGSRAMLRTGDRFHTRLLDRLQSVTVTPSSTTPPPPPPTPTTTTTATLAQSRHT